MSSTHRLESLMHSQSNDGGCMTIIMLAGRPSCDESATGSLSSQLAATSCTGTASEAAMAKDLGPRINIVINIGSGMHCLKANAGNKIPLHSWWAVQDLNL